MAVDLSKFNVPGAGEASLVQPKLSYRFRVTLTGFGGDSASDEVLTLTSQVVSVSRPSLTHDDVVVDVYNSRIFLAGKHTWDPITLTVRDDVTGNVARAIAKQLQQQVDHAGQTGAKTGQTYKFSMGIENLDGTDDAAILDKWTLGGCYIQNVNYGENNYATSDPLQITLQIKYDNANLDVEEAPVLEGNNGQNAGDGANSGSQEDSSI